MEDIQEIITKYYGEITVLLFISVILLFISLVVSQYKYRKFMENYNKLVRGIKGLDIEELLININDDIRDINDKIDANQRQVKEINTKLSFAIQRVGFVRYNAFREMGSELSFSLALLDEFKNGVIYSSIYGRDNTVSYGKPIKNGTSNIPLSAEEILALDRAIKGESP